MAPEEPGKNAIGTNTADRTSAIPISAPVICVIDFRVASLGDNPSSAIILSTFSTTTMASSTSKPIASTMANIVSTLIEKPKIDNIAKVPNKTTGTAIVGINVALKFCKKRNITTKTRPIASASVIATSFIDNLTKGVVSYG